jgi:superfamily I DNA/RNA helicase
MRTWSTYQLAVFKNVAEGTGHTVVNAVAGSGKSTTLEEAVNHIPKGLRTLSVAFNKDIATAMAKRLAGKPVEVSTLHSYGLKCITASLGRLTIDEYRVHGFVEDLYSAEIARLEKAITESKSEAEAFEFQEQLEAIDDRCRMLIKTVSLSKNTLALTPVAIDEVMYRFGIELPTTEEDEEGAFGDEAGDDAAEADRQKFVQEVLGLLRRCYSTEDGKIDFDDMVWLPVVRKLRQRKFDRVFVDECLPGPTPVLLADGSSRTIQDLVESRYSGDVLAYDTATGKQRPCRVTGWQTILNQKPLVKIKARWSQRKGTNRPTNFIICTEDHKVWANGAWVPAGDVKPGMVLQVETSAEKSQVGKITKRGRATLAEEIRRKNKAGMMGGVAPTVFNGVRGGNGKGPTVPEQALMDALGEGWVWQYAIPTKKSRGYGYPTAYKVDIAKPGCKIAIEVDGHSHGLRRAHDEKKDRLLESLGWTVIRVPNRRAVQNAKEEAERILAMTNCPIDAVVESVEPVTIPSFHVYDLTVEDLHCFYANGILVHNCQDLNAAQIELTLRSVKSDGRILACGDPRQAIYQFRGADERAFENVKEGLGATELPLSICYRCSKAVIRKAQELVPSIQASPDAPDGTVLPASREQMEREAQPGDFILSRTNAPLIGLCMFFLKNGRRANIQGRDVGKTLASFVKKSKAADIPAFRAHVEEWAKKEIARLAAKKRDTQAVEDRAACLIALSDGAVRVADVLARIEELFSDKSDGACIMLSTTHKAKGLERDRVWLLIDTYRPSISMEEANCLYVAQTRAKHTLVLVGGFAKKSKSDGAEGA